jgi:hypothetical protein
MICIDVEHMEKILVPILDGFHKHNGRKKCKCVKLGPVVSAY